MAMASNPASLARAMAKENSGSFFAQFLTVSSVGMDLAAQMIVSGVPADNPANTLAAWAAVYLLGLPGGRPLAFPRVPLPFPLAGVVGLVPLAGLAVVVFFMAV